MSKELNHFERMSHLTDSMGIAKPTKTSFQFGVTAEQERIIKMLEGIKTYPSGWDYDDPFASVIALIKGEIKNDNTNF